MYFPSTVYTIYVQEISNLHTHFKCFAFQLVQLTLIRDIQMEQKGMTFDHDFYVVVGKQCRTENVYAGHQHDIFI